MPKQLNTSSILFPTSDGARPTNAQSELVALNSSCTKYTIYAQTLAPWALACRLLVWLSIVCAARACSFVTIQIHYQNNFEAFAGNNGSTTRRSEKCRKCSHSSTTNIRTICSRMLYACALEHHKQITYSSAIHSSPSPHSSSLRLRMASANFIIAIKLNRTDCSHFTSTLQRAHIRGGAISIRARNRASLECVTYWHARSSNDELLMIMRVLSCTHHRQLIRLHMVHSCTDTAQKRHAPISASLEVACDVKCLA